MANKLAVINEFSAVGELQFTKEQTQLIKDMVAVNATDNELQLFLHHAKKSGLDPLARQIYFIKRNVWNGETKRYDEKATIQTSIDGYRIVAERSGVYAGQPDEPKFEKVKSVGDNKKEDIKCSINVYKWNPATNEKYLAAIGVAYWSEYAPAEGKGDFMWKKMPRTMLAKVAEALALRKAFPHDLSGVYTNEEMEQAPGEPTQTVEAIPESGQATLEQANEIMNGKEEVAQDEVVDESNKSSKIVLKITDKQIEVLKIHIKRTREIIGDMDIKSLTRHDATGIIGEIYLQLDKEAKNGK